MQDGSTNPGAVAPPADVGETWMTKPTKPTHLETDASSKALVTKVEKRRAPLARKFKASIEKEVEIQQNRLNDGLLRGLTADEVAFHLSEGDHKLRRAFHETNLDPKIRLNWRALMEVFIKTLVPDLGAPKKVSKSEGQYELLRFVREMDTIRREKLKGKWSCSRVAKHLKEDAQYCKRYRGIKPAALRKRIERIAKLIGPMDDDAPSRAYYMCNPRCRIEEMGEQDSSRGEDDGSQ